MTKTSIYLDFEVDRALTRSATALNRDVQAKAIAAARPRPLAAGVFEGPGDLARNDDHYLTQTGFGER